MQSKTIVPFRAKKSSIFNLKCAIALVLALTSVTTVRAQYTGDCGLDVDYYMSTEDGYLRIYGTGNMYNWSGYNDEAHPWKNSFLNQYVERIIIEDGVTNIGNYAFVHFDNIKVLIVNTTTPLPNAANSQLYNRNNIKLFVPQGAIDTYQAYDWWNGFGGYFEGGKSLVQFVDWDGTVLQEDSVIHGMFARKPSTNPTRSGYRFTGWDKTDSQLDLVYGPMTITAQYELGEPTDINILFVGQDDSEIINNSASIKVPAAPEIDGFTFLKWRVVESDLSDRIEIRAVYESNTPTPAPVVVVPDPANPARKLIREGNVYILRDGRTYNAQGVEVR